MGKRKAGRVCAVDEHGSDGVAKKEKRRPRHIRWVMGEEVQGKRAKTRNRPAVG